MKKSLILKYLVFVVCISIIVNLSYALKLRYSDHKNFTRVVIEGENVDKYYINETGNEVRVKIRPMMNLIVETQKNSNRISYLGFNKNNNTTEVMFKLKDDYKIKKFTLKSPFRIVIDFFDKTRTVLKKEDKNNNKENNRKGADFNNSNVNIVNNKKNNKDSNKREIRTIVIDPGHGGTDYGAKGSPGIYEKDITLEIAKILKNYIENYIGLKVFLTRKSDIDLSLEERASIANNYKADIFVSIHCNASRSKRAKGSETFILSLKATDKEARRLAFYENNFEEMPQNSQESDDIKLILWDMAQTEYLRDSADLAILIQNELNILLGTKNRGIKQAPFRVLMNVAMPAVLIETAFLTNSQEEKMLIDKKYQDKIAYAIFLGIKRYLIKNNE